MHVIARTRKGAQHRGEHSARHGAMLRRDAIATLSAPSMRLWSASPQPPSSCASAGTFSKRNAYTPW